MMKHLVFFISATIAFELTTGIVLAEEDVMLQTMGGRIVSGAIDDDSGIGELGVRVFHGDFLANFGATEPGFFSLTSVNPNLPSGASGFPAQHDVGFDLLPMHTAEGSSNLLYWDGGDVDGAGLDLSDVHWGTPPDVEWQVLNGNSQLIAATGTDQIVPGGLIARTSSETNPGDGIDTGMLHKHLALLLNSTGAATPPAGVYLIAWQVYAAGFESSEPFVFVHRTSTVADSVRDLAADWVEANLAAMFSSGLPGDYNEDGSVDAADYAVWRDRLKQSVSLPNETASYGVVDSEDYEVWKASFGQAFGGGARARFAIRVPEPSSALIAICGAWISTALAARKRARRAPGSTRRRH
jgi:hypothetical protein